MPGNSFHMDEPNFLLLSLRMTDCWTACTVRKKGRKNYLFDNKWRVAEPTELLGPLLKPELLTLLRLLKFIIGQLHFSTQVTEPSAGAWLRNTGGNFSQLINKVYMQSLLFQQCTIYILCFSTSVLYTYSIVCFSLIYILLFQQCTHTYSTFLAVYLYCILSAFLAVYIQIKVCFAPQDHRVIGLRYSVLMNGGLNKLYSQLPRCLNLAHCF